LPSYENIIKNKKKDTKNLWGTQPKPMNKKQANYKAIHKLRSPIHRKKKLIMIKVQTYKSWDNRIPFKHFSRR